MGIVKENTHHLHWLNKYGYEYNDDPVAGDFSGYENGYLHNHDFEYLWVTICFPQKTVFLYNEYNCGGLLWENELQIPDGIYSTDEQEFIDWLDKEIDFLIGEK